MPPYPGACCRMVDKWILQRAGFSALARFGRDFRTDEDVARWLAEPGGIAVAVNRVMRAAGFARTKAPEIGDVGLTLHKGLLAMAICSGSIWIGRDDRGMFGTPAVWKAWSLA